MLDKFSAVWVSHSSISDFEACPRAYFLKHIYRDPRNNHKVKMTGPALSLGQCVHEVLESLTILPKDRRFDESLVEKFQKVWKKVSGKRGGFLNQETEYAYRQRGEEMMRRVMNHPGPLAELSVKINLDLPYYWLSEEENIILCGKIDWLKYIPEDDSVYIIDFKTGKSEESDTSLQLPIYHLLAHHCQKRKISGAAYWYLSQSDELSKKELPDLEKSAGKVLEAAKKIKMARQLERFRCPNGESGCPACKPFEAIVAGRAELVGNDEYGAGVYVLPNAVVDEDREGLLL